MPGVNYTQMETNNNNICFRIPIDAGSCDNCNAIIRLYQDNNGLDGKIQTISNVVVLNSNVSSNDNTGPHIYITQNENLIEEGTVIISDADLTINLNDSSGINLMESIGHGIRYAFNNNDLILIPSNEFVYKNCSEGTVQIPIDLTNTSEQNYFYIEAWDGLNNKSSFAINFEILPKFQEDQFSLSKVYPFPNPFSENTYFTMYVSDVPTKITINVYTLNGKEVIKLEGIAYNKFYTMPWNGKNQYGENLANGSYFYSVKAKKDGMVVFDNIYKLAKIK